MHHPFNRLVKTAMSEIAVVALILAYFGWNALIRADEESIIPRAEDDAAKEVEFDPTVITKLKFTDAEGESWSVTIPKVGLAEE